MDTLPQELIHLISSHLELEDLKQTLLVSPSFQYAAEELSGAFANFSFWEGKTSYRFLDHGPLDASENSIQEDCTKFLNTFSGHRLRFLRHVRVHTFLPILPQLGEGERYRPCRENMSNLQEKDECFTRQVRAVLQSLKKIETEAKGQCHGRIYLTIFTPIRWIHVDHCVHQWYSSWRVHLLSPEDIPDLESVTGLSLCVPHSDDSKNRILERHACTRARPDARMLIDIAARCPNLEFLDCELGLGEWKCTEEDIELQHFSRDFEACQLDSRTGFTNALNTHVLPKTLRYARLDFLRGLSEHISEQRGGCLDMVGLARFDGFSAGLRNLTMHLRRLDLRLIADESLFWPVDGSNVTAWQSLEELYVVFHLRTPSGSWYFQGPFGEGKDDKGYSITSKMYPPMEEASEDLLWHDRAVFGHEGEGFARFRVIPNETILVPFLSSFAKVARTMRALERAALWAPLIFDPHNMPEQYQEFEPDSISPHLYGTEFAFGLLYLGPGSDTASSDRELYWSTGRWRPDSELRESFSQIGGGTGHLSETWHDGLVERSEFDDSTLFFDTLNDTRPSLIKRTECNLI